MTEQEIAARTSADVARLQEENARMREALKLAYAIFLYGDTRQSARLAFMDAAGPLVAAHGMTPVALDLGVSKGWV
jgi:hypothetical protein